MIFVFKKDLLPILTVIILLVIFKPASPLPLSSDSEYFVDDPENPFENFDTPSTTTEQSLKLEKSPFSPAFEQVFSELGLYLEFLEKNGSLWTPDAEQNMAKILMKLPRTDIELIAKAIYCVKHPAKCVRTKIEKTTIPFKELQKKAIQDCIDFLKKYYRYFQEIHPSPKLVKTKMSCRGKEVEREFAFYMEFLAKNGTHLTPDAEQNLAKIWEKFPPDDLKLFVELTYCLGGKTPTKCEWIKSVKNTIPFEEFQKRIIRDFIQEINEQAKTLESTTKPGSTTTTTEEYYDLNLWN